MRCPLDLLPAELKHKVEKIKAYLNENPKDSLHDVANEEDGCRLAREASDGWANQNSKSSMCEVSLSSSK